MNSKRLIKKQSGCETWPIEITINSDYPDECKEFNLMPGNTYSGFEKICEMEHETSLVTYFVNEEGRLLGCLTLINGNKQRLETVIMPNMGNKRHLGTVQRIDDKNTDE